MKHTETTFRIIDIGKELGKAVLITIEHEALIRSQEPEQESDQGILIKDSCVLVQIESLGLERVPVL